jgi:3-carboxy-cis,cis-muconate cycloisomerase
MLLAGALAQSRFILTGLEVDAKRMRANLDLTNGLVVSEAVMMGLAPHIGRQTAHDVVYDACRIAATKGLKLAEVLYNDAKISGKLDRATIDRLCDPANYLGAAPEMVDRMRAWSSKY